MGLNMSGNVAEGRLGFLKRQNGNYKAILFKDTLFNLTSTHMVGSIPASQYYLLYISSLGANPAQLGFLRSLGLISTALISIPAGWLSDRYSVKKILLMGVFIHTAVALNFILATDWFWILPACIFAFVGFNLHRESASLVLVNSLNKQDRGMGMGINKALCAIPGIVCPFLAAYLVSRFGGFTAEGIRPLFYIQLIGLAIIFLFMAFKLKDKRLGNSLEKISFSGDIKGLFREGVGLKRWILMVAILSFMEGITIPIKPLYLVNIKSADPFILAAMTASTTFMLLLFSVPIGKLSDKWGRKKVIFLLRPLFYCSRILLVFSPAPIYLIFVGILDAFSAMVTVTGVLWITMQMELVESSRRGIWQGIILTLRALFKTPAAIIGGVAYMKFNPSILFLLPIITDLILILPIFTTLPETMKRISTSNKI
jgi:MFS family permease